MKQNKNKVFRLIGQVQHYAWGGVSFLPRLLHLPNPDGKPFAEYWLGAHDKACSILVLSAEQTIKLNEYIQTSPAETLGNYAQQRFGRLPYLLKILDVKDMLSIQVHPSKISAENKFEEENRRGIALNAANRNYKDNNHKPELMLALCEFWLLHGFKTEDQLMWTLQHIPVLNFLLPVFEKGGYEELYRTVMEMNQSKVNEVLQPLLDKIIPAYQNKQLEKNDENFWAARAALTFNEGGKTDRGIFSIYFFNLVNLRPGEAIFQDAGLPHAYLEGQNVEIMANSDNVLRGGLTSKHIDVKELMSHVKFEANVPDILHGKDAGEHVQLFITHAPDFELSKIELKKGKAVSLSSDSAAICIVLGGNIIVQENQDNQFDLEAGEAFISFDKSQFQLKAMKDAVLYRATVPSPQE